MDFMKYLRKVSLKYSDEMLRSHYCKSLFEFTCTYLHVSNYNEVCICHWYVGENKETYDKFRMF